MKKIIFLGMLVSTMQMPAFDLQTMVRDLGEHPKKAAMVFAASMIARPLAKLVAQYVRGDEHKAFSAGSVVGTKIGIKNAAHNKSERVRAQFSVGSLDVKVKVPTRLGFDEFIDQVKPTTRSGVPAYVADALASLLASFSPYVHVGIATKDTPIVRDKAAGVTPKTKRLFAEAACGTLCLRTGMDLEDALLAPLALLTAYLSSYFTDIAA